MKCKNQEFDEKFKYCFFITEIIFIIIIIIMFIIYSSKGKKHSGQALTITASVGYVLINALIMCFNSLGPMDAFSHPKIFGFFSKKKKKKLARPDPRPTYIGLFESPMPYPPGYHVRFDL